MMIAWGEVLIDAAVLLVLPLALALALAWPFWQRRRVLIGNALGSALIGAWMLVLIIQRFSVYFIEPSADAVAILTPLLLPVLFGWVDVLILFFISGAVEDRVKRRFINPDDF
jgi:hypothetical protein